MAAEHVRTERTEEAVRYAWLYAQRERRRRRWWALLRQLDVAQAECYACGARAASAGPPPEGWAVDGVPTPKSAVEDWEALRAMLLQQLEDFATW